MTEATLGIDLDSIIPNPDDTPAQEITPTEFGDDGWWEELLFGGAGEQLFVDAELGAIPDPDKATNETDDDPPPRIDDEDFLEGPELVAFQTLKKNVRLATNVSSSEKQRKEAVEWLFIPSTDNRQGISCSLCCQGLGIREAVFHSRLMYQFYKSGLSLQSPLPFLAVTIPAWFSSEIIYHAGDTGLKIAKHLWDRPGYRADLLRKDFADLSPKAFDTAVEIMEDKGFIAIKFGCWFFTGRNPAVLSLLARRRFSWTREFA